MLSNKTCQKYLIAELCLVSMGIISQQCTALKCPVNERLTAASLKTVAIHLFLTSKWSSWTELASEKYLMVYDQMNPLTFLSSLACTDQLKNKSLCNFLAETK